MKKKTSLATSHDPGPVTTALTNLIHEIPTSEEPVAPLPAVRAQEVARAASLKAAGVSSALALPPGPLGFATIIPDLVLIWKIQRSMVADIAAAFGKTGSLTQESLLYCMFKHGGAAIARDLVARVGERYLVRQPNVRALQDILGKIGIHVTQRVITRSFSRMIPIIGSLGVGAYAFYDTTQVASNAVELFSQDVIHEPATYSLPQKKKSATRAKPAAARRNRASAASSAKRRTNAKKNSPRKRIVKKKKSGS
ncbi:MAG: hypothetical protein ACREIA_08755 [Opitutaceae bacterium]